MPLPPPLPPAPLMAFVTTSDRLLAAPITLRLQSTVDPGRTGAPRGPLAQAACDRILTVEQALLAHDRDAFHVESEVGDEIRHLDPNTRAYMFSATITLTPRWDDPADLLERARRFDTIMAILTGVGTQHHLLPLVDWVTQPLLNAWTNDLRATKQAAGISGGTASITFGLNVAKRHFGALRAVRSPLLAPYLNGFLPTTDPALFALLHHVLPAEAAYVALRMAGGSMGTLHAPIGGEVEAIAESLVDLKILRRAGTDGNKVAKYARTTALVSGLRSDEILKVGR